MDNPSVILDSLKDWWLLLINFAFSAILIYLGWRFKEQVERSNKIYLQKVERYDKLIELIENLKENMKPGDTELRDKFMHQINLCWLYCPDQVVQKIIDFVLKFNDDKVSKKEREETVGELMITLRRDAQFKKTKLNRVDYENIRPAMLRHFVLKAETGIFKLEGADIKMTHGDRNGNIIPPQSQEKARTKSWWQFWRRV